MTLREIIEEIKKLNSPEQHRLKEFFINSLSSFSASEPVFQEVTERKKQRWLYLCPLWFKTSSPFR
jgi:hypothetical protein